MNRIVREDKERRQWILQLFNAAKQLVDPDVLLPAGEAVQTARELCQAVHELKHVVIDQQGEVFDLDAILLFDNSQCRIAFNQLAASQLAPRYDSIWPGVSNGARSRSVKVSLKQNVLNLFDRDEV